MRKYLLLLLLPLLLTGCSLFKAPVFEKVNTFQLNSLTPDHTDIDLSVVIHNPNKFDIRINSLDVILRDKDKDKLGNIRLSNPIIIPKVQSDTLFFAITLDTRRIAKLISHSSQNVFFYVDLTANARVWGITKTVHSEQMQTVNLTQILESMLPGIPVTYNTGTVKYKDIKAKSNAPATGQELFKIISAGLSDVSFSTCTFSIKFLLLNPYGLSYTIKDFPAQLSLNGTNVGKGNLKTPLVFDENVYSREGEIVVQLNSAKTLWGSAKSLKNSLMNYEVKGTVDAEGFGISLSRPFSFAGSIDFGTK